MKKFLITAIIFMSFSFVTQAAETRYSRAIEAYNDAFIKPIKPKLPALIEKLKLFKKAEDKLSASQKKEMEKIILTLKRYNFIKKLNAIFVRCHHSLNLIPNDEGEIDDAKVDFSDPKVKQARVELNACSKEIKSLFQEYPEISNEPEIAKILRTAFSEPKKKKKKKKKRNS